jgi:hypothetical protein
LTFHRALAAALAAVTLAGCTISGGPTASDARITTPKPNPADSKASDFRTRVDLLLGEHVIVIAKQSSAARRSDEFTSYLHLLTANGSDLTDLMRSALGNSGANQFDKIWTAQNDYLVNYTIGLVTHNRTKSDGAMRNLVGGFVPQFSQLVSTAAEVPIDPIAQLTTQHVLQTKAMIDDQIATSYPRMYADLRLVYAQASRLGDAFAPKIAQRVPDKFPGNASSRAVDLRVSMNGLLQEHSYLATMTTSAAVGGRTSEQAAASAALAENINALGALVGDLFGPSAGVQFDQVWAAKNAALIDYASAPTATARQSPSKQLNEVFVPRFSGFVQTLTDVDLRPAVESQIQATIDVIDDQLSKSWTKLGADDRSAEASMELIADLVAAGAIAKLPKRFPA